MAKTPVSLLVEAFKPTIREVANFKMTFSQATDAEGQVTGLVRGGKITMKMKALNYGNTDMARWMTDSKKTSKGIITFKDTTTGIIMKTIEFFDAYCVNYTEYWEDTTKPEDLAHWEEITISCREIKIGKMDLFKNTWELVK